MTQVNHGKGNKVPPHEIDITAGKTQQQGTELVNPGERALTGETPFVDFSIEQAVAASLGGLTIAFVLSHVALVTSTPNSY